MTPDTALSVRAERMSVLAKADGNKLVERWMALGLDPEFSLLRPPQTGLIGMRGRIGGGGDAFNFGEATITRATVKLATGEVGHAWCLGRNHTKAKLSAVIDALAQDLNMADRIEREVISHLRREADERDILHAAQTAATKVDFFTMVRGED